ncbi:MAG: DMT family transporter [Geothermobacteraceae bacterium]
MDSSSHLRGVATVVAGVVIISFDALLVRLAGVDGWNVSFWRGLFMGVSMLLVARMRGGVREPLRWGYWLAALLMAASSLALVLAFTLTRAANAVVILSMSPLFAALTSRIFLKERCPLRTWVAIALCIAGVVAVMAGSMGGGNLVGDGLALLSTLFIGGYFTVFRRYPEVSRVRVISLGGFLLAGAAVGLATPLDLPAVSYGWLALAGLVQMPLALVLLTSGTRFLPAAEVSLFILLETILAPIWVWLVIGEVPPQSTLLGGALIVATLVGHTLVGMGKQSSA